MFKNYYEKQRNKTAIYTKDGTPIIVDTSHLNRIIEHVRRIELSKSGFPIATLCNGTNVPLSIFVTRATRKDYVKFLNKKTDCRMKSLEVTRKEYKER
ncbi:hypothetical protein ACFRCQ_07530 [Cytobacillus firmus]|uniref:hypothetical protein n=1 Tax=Cytobacillus firmus TaxID=1399 RepID=UPI00369A571E